MINYDLERLKSKTENQIDLHPIQMLTVIFLFTVRKVTTCANFSLYS